MIPALLFRLGRMEEGLKLKVAVYFNVTVTSLLLPWDSSSDLSEMTVESLGSAVLQDWALDLIMPYS